jgi:hypothetical protein
MMRPDPDADGWWISAIHASLLPSGDVLINGWARPQGKSCPSHTGRQWPASFIVRVAHDQPTLEGAKNNTLYVSPIHEHGDDVGGATPKDPVDVLYCSGHAPLSDGRILFTGGAHYTDLEFDKLDEDHMHGDEDEYGLNYARVFDPKTSSFTRVQSNYPDGPTTEDIKKIESSFPGKITRDWAAIYKKGMMWYPTNLRLPDGRMLIAAGFARQSGPFDPQFINRSLVIFDPKKIHTDPWSVLVPHVEIPAGQHSPSEVLDLAGFDYVHLFLLPMPVRISGRSYQVALYGGLHAEYGLLTLDSGVPANERILIPPTDRDHSPVRPVGLSGKAPGGSDTTGVVLPSGEIVMIGGGVDGRDDSRRIDVYNPYTNTWRPPLYTGTSRIRAASVLLPTGEILILNGEESYTPGTNLGDRRRPIVFNPETNEVRELEPWSDDESDRGYHNFAILLKDARVLLGGGRELIKDRSGTDVHRIGCERADLRVYSPEYLFQGPRPVISTRDVTMNINGPDLSLPYSGETLKKHGGVVLMGLPSETHHFDQNQRMVVLNYQVAGQQIRIMPPKSSLAAPIGNYTMYFVSESNVPSEGVSVRLTEARSGR